MAQSNIYQGITHAFSYYNILVIAQPPVPPLETFHTNTDDTRSMCPVSIFADPFNSLQSQNNSKDLYHTNHDLNQL